MEIWQKCLHYRGELSVVCARALQREPGLFIYFFHPVRFEPASIIYFIICHLSKELRLNQIGLNCIYVTYALVSEVVAKPEASFVPQVLAVHGVRSTCSVRVLEQCVLHPRTPDVAAAATATSTAGPRPVLVHRRHLLQVSAFHTLISVQLFIVSSIFVY